MRLDPKYFNLFIGTIGVLSIILIGYFTVTYFFSQHREFEEQVGDGQEFRERVFEAAEDGSSVSLQDFSGRPVVLDFWATWSSRSQQPHEIFHELQQQYPDLVIISALVKDDLDDLNNYKQDHGYDFVFVNGTETYQDFLVPGVPTYLFFNRDGEVYDVVVGFRGSDDFHNLKAYLEENE